MATFRKLVSALLLLLLHQSRLAEALVPLTSIQELARKSHHFQKPSRFIAANNDVDISANEDPSAASTSSNLYTRRSLATPIVTSCTVAALSLCSSLPSHALVKGNAPPLSKPKATSSNSDVKKKCTNVEECQELAMQQAEREQREALANVTPSLLTAGGTRYRDETVGDSSSLPITTDTAVTIHYKVLKLGKRSYDGLSGEGTVVFSRGYGLEDDEDQVGAKSYSTIVGSPFNIVALNEALVGMRLGGIRRFVVLPQQGWQKPTKACDGGPGGRGSGGDLKTDYVVVPTATMVAQEACFDTSKQPFPTDYAKQRRMAQRFDQSLIMEVQVVKVGGNGLNGNVDGL